MVDDIKKTDTSSIPARHKAVLWIGMLLLSCYACTRGIGAGDTWVALACGRHFSNHGVDTVEPFSFNSHKAGPTEAELEKYPEWSREAIKKIHPTGWIDQNWGTQLMYYTLAKNFGTDGEYNYNMLIVWKFAIAILSAICIFYLGRLLGANQYMSAISAGFAMYVARTFIDVRPAVFSNLLVPLFVLILMLAVYRNIRYIWLLVPLSVFWCNVHGGYMYIFILGAAFIGLNLLTSIPNDKFISLGCKATLHAALVGFISLVATVIFNPFHLTNITHTLEVTISKHAESWRNVHEWHGAFDWGNRVGSSYPFLVMFIIMWVVLAFWLIARMYKPRVTGKMSRQIKPAEPGDFQWPKIDLAFLFITAFTVYMAVKSRRFIPIAAALACPMIAVFICQSFKMISAGRRFRRDYQLKPWKPSAGLTRICMMSVTTLIVVLGIVWGSQFKTTYLDPWGSDDERTSIFMRMTASYMKPFEVCEFINANKLSGHMFNYWTEGGAIAFGQNPDPETGHIPLKLFMDGRAQAAYDHDTYKKWTHIYSGGPTVQRAALSGRALTVADYKKIGEWITEELKPYDVWVVLMPDTNVYYSQSSTFTRGLEATGRWQAVYIDDSQYLYVDTESDKGGELINKVLREQAIFPNEFSRYLSVGRLWLMQKDRERSLRGFEYLKKAFEIDPSFGAMYRLILSRNLAHIKPLLYPYIEDYVKEFMANKDSYEKQDGYFKKLQAAQMAARYLPERYARTDPEKAKLYDTLAKKYESEFKFKYGKAKW